MSPTGPIKEMYMGTFFFRIKPGEMETNYRRVCGHQWALPPSLVLFSSSNPSLTLPGLSGESGVKCLDKLLHGTARGSDIYSKAINLYSQNIRKGCCLHRVKPGGFLNKGSEAERSALDPSCCVQLTQTLQVPASLSIEGGQ